MRHVVILQLVGRVTPLLTPSAAAPAFQANRTALTR
jgi:hypothetical protein